MARVRIGGIRAGAPPARVRIGGIKVSGATSSTPRVRIGGIKASGALNLEPRVRLGGIRGRGTAAVIIEEFTDIVNPIPGALLEITANLQVGSPAPEEYVWAQASGPTVDYTTDENVLYLYTPAVMNGSNVPIGGTVEFTVGGRVGVTMSPLTTVEITFLPETQWTWKASTSKWVGASRL